MNITRRDLFRMLATIPLVKQFVPVDPPFDPHYYEASIPTGTSILVTFTDGDYSSEWYDMDRGLWVYETGVTRNGLTTVTSRYEGDIRTL